MVFELTKKYTISLRKEQINTGFSIDLWFLISATTELFERIADKALTVRRITIAANRVVKDEGFFQVDLFTDTTKLEKEKKMQNAMLGLKKKFGKNAVLKGTNYLDGATMRERNQQIGGHKAK